MAEQVQRTNNDIVSEFEDRFNAIGAGEAFTRTQEDLKQVDNILKGIANADDSINNTWNDIISQQIKELSYKYGLNTDNATHSPVASVLARWHKQATIDYKHDANFAPHVNGFYMIFMVHGPWYKSYQEYVSSDDTNEAGLSKMPVLGGTDEGQPKRLLTLSNPHSYFNMLATDIDVPDITEEYISVSSRIRNSFTPSRSYFVSDFSISYIENINLDVIRYHEAWHKYLNLIHRGEVDLEGSSAECARGSKGYFVEMPYANAVWIAVFKPFTTEIQLLIKLLGVMPVTMPLKQVVGNRSASKMTVLNMTYKASDIFYKFYNSTAEFIADEGNLADSFRSEVMNLDKLETS